MMKIGLVTDEVSGDPREALEAGRRMGIEHYELRGVWGKRIPRLQEDEVRRLSELIGEFEVQVTALSPGLFKIPLTDAKRLEEHAGSLLRETFELGEGLDVRRIIVFGFESGQGSMQEVVDRLGTAAELAEEHDFTLLLENEAGCWADTAQSTLEVLEGVRSPALRLNWDPGNARRAGGDPFPAGYALIREHVDNVHFKDVREVNGTMEWTTPEEGLIDWEGQLQALKGDGYRGLVTIETHCRPRLENTIRDLRFLRQHIDTQVR